MVYSQTMQLSWMQELWDSQFLSSSTMFSIHGITTSVIFCIVLILSYIWYEWTRGLPPGPPRWPLLGSIPYLGMDVRKPLLKLAKRYGDVFTIYLGSKRVIILNSHAAVKEAFVDHGHAISGRPQDLFFIKHITKGNGIISSEGPTWATLRRFGHSTLRRFGVGTNGMEEKIKEELTYLTDILKEKVDHAYSLHYMVNAAVANIIHSVVFGRRCAYTDADFIHHLESMELGFEVSGNIGLAEVFPWLIKFPGDPFKVQQVLKNKEWIDAIDKRKIEEHKSTYDPALTRDLVDAFLHELHNVSPDDPCFNSVQMLQVIGDIFGAGTETTTTTLIWCMVYMLHHPHVQKRVQAEVDEVVGSARRVKMTDKTMLPYTQATLLEIQRCASIVPLGVPHSCTQDVTIRGYRIPKGTTFMSHIYAVHMDARIWDDPMTFHPERFLDDQGELCKSDKWIPFSMGKRVCLGEMMAKMEVFLFFTTLMQLFSFSLPPGDPLPELTGKLGSTLSPPRFHVLMALR